VYDFLANMCFYSIVPSKLRELQTPDPGDLLKPDGRNAAAVLKRIEDEDPERYRRICALLSSAVAGMKSAHHRTIGQFETVEFRQDIGQKYPWTFDALNVSDGTLRMLGLLVAVYQLGPASVLGIEEPEATMHPAVTEQILEVLMDAARLRQILVTTHSPDLLDINGIDDGQLRVVTNPGSETVIAPLAGVLVLLDADRDCPATLGPTLCGRCEQTTSVPAKVVLAKAETEAWTLAGIDSVRGQRGIRDDALPPDDPESVQDAKRALSKHMAGSRGYVATDDQPALLSLMAMATVKERSASFAKLYRDVSALVR
jgi:hypothetical protein